MTLNFSGNQIQGDRDNQEDSYFTSVDMNLPSNETCLLIVADGMGGYSGGEEASQIAVKIFPQVYSQSQDIIVNKLQSSLDAVSDAIKKSVENNRELRKMGTTIVSAAIADNLLHWISVGDSPMWLFREEKLIRVNADHSMASVFLDLIEVGRMTKEEAANDPNRHVLRSVVNKDKIAMIDVSKVPVELNDGDLILLASDGLETLNEESIIQILAENINNNADKICKKLVDAVAAENKPNQDNTTVVVYKHKTNERNKSISKTTGTDPKIGKITKFSMLKYAMLLSVFILVGFLFYIKMADETVDMTDTVDVVGNVGEEKNKNKVKEVTEIEVNEQVDAQDEMKVENKIEEELAAKLNLTKTTRNKDVTILEQDSMPKTNEADNRQALATPKNTEFNQENTNVLDKTENQPAEISTSEIVTVPQKTTPDDLNKLGQESTTTDNNDNLERQIDADSNRRIIPPYFWPINPYENNFQPPNNRGFVPNTNYQQQRNNNYAR